MKASKLVAISLAAGMVIAAVACAGGGPAPTPTPSPRPQAMPTATPALAATPSPTVGALAAGEFHGIPVPSGATQAQAITWQMPASQPSGEYANAEWRAFRIRLSQDELKSFYKGEMPRRGWTQAMWFEGSVEQGEMAWGFYSKGANQNEAAWVYVVPKEEEFNLILMWAGDRRR